MCALTVRRGVHAIGKAKVLASALKAAGIKAGEKMGIYASNCPEWMLCILAANRSSVSVGAAPSHRSRAQDI